MWKSIIFYKSLSKENFLREMSIELTFSHNFLEFFSKFSSLIIFFRQLIKNAVKKFYLPVNLIHLLKAPF